MQIEVNVNQIENLKNQMKDAEKDLDDQKTTIQGLREQLITLKELSPEADMRRSTLESSLEKYRQESLQKDIRIKELNVEILEKEDHIDFLKSSLQSIDTELLMTLQSENTSLKERESLASSLEAVTKNWIRFLSNQANKYLKDDNEKQISKNFTFNIMQRWYLLQVLKCLYNIQLAS